jgi:glycosyltransferase involved in cell wall biosynthesis
MTKTDKLLLDRPLTIAPERSARKTRTRKAALQRRSPACLPVKDAEFLRQCAWEIGEKQPALGYVPPGSSVGLAVVSPAQGFVHWRICPEWVGQTAQRRGHAWTNCRLILRLYDVSYIDFNGLNAHRIQDHDLPGLCGQQFFPLPRPGSWQLAETGFLLRDGEFIPAARSQAVAFPMPAPSRQGSHAALLVGPGGRVEPIDNLWEQDRILAERRRRRLRASLRIAAFAFSSLPSGQDGALAQFVTELAAGQRAQGHEVHVFVRASSSLGEAREIDGVYYHPLHFEANGDAVRAARAFRQAAEECLQDLSPFDLLHHHEWMTGLGRRPGPGPRVLSLGSVEATRRNGSPRNSLSTQIEKVEGRVARSADRVLTPPWLRDRLVTELDLEGERVTAFPMEGRVPNEWECPLDYGQVKMGIGVGPLDRLLLFVGPLEYAAGVDLLVEALPFLLQRWSNLRLAYVGMGELYGQLRQRADHLGVGHAVRLLGHVEGLPLMRLLRAAEALALPSRYRVPFDDAVVDLARRAGRPVITTHGGPAHVVRHEETGIVTYDNPGSMVWALDRILGDAAHAERMGQNGRRSDPDTMVWADVARHYLELCTGWFPELTEMSR